MTVNWSDLLIKDVNAAAWRIRDTKDSHPQNICFYIKGSPEPIIKIDETGFYVRGKRVPQDENEAKVVYNAFHQHITWSTLNR